MRKDKIAKVKTLAKELIEAIDDMETEEKQRTSPHGSYTYESLKDRKPGDAN